MRTRSAGLAPLTALALCACAGSGRPAPTADTTVSPAVNVAIAMPDLPDVPTLPDVVAARDVAAPVDAPRSAFAGETITVLIHQVAVYHAPRVDTSWYGSLRAGAQVRVVSGPFDDDGCPAFEGRPDTGWYEIEHGGFVCVSRGATLTRHLRRIARTPRPTQPHRDAAMPYLYAMASRDAVLYRALPTDADEQSIEPERFHDMGDLAPANAPPPRTLEELDGFEGTPVLRRLARGMFVSLDRPQRSETDTPFWRTLSGGWVRAADVQFVGAPGLHGVRLDATLHLPLRIVTAAQASLYRPNARGVMTRGRRAARWSALPAGDAAPVTVRDDTFVATSDGWYARQRDVRDVTAHAPPDDLSPGERWIDVNLDHQFVVAYEGATPVFATLMSSGIPSQEGASYETVQGSFRLEQKHLTTTMDGNATSGAYSIEDVPWVMYFRDSFALHGAFWHSGFGAVRSHGCVNLSPDDARWLFHWTSPTLPDGWHAVFATARDPGTRVYVHYDRQRLGESGGPSEVPGH